MSTNSAELVLGQVPEPVRRGAESMGIADGEVLFSVRSDLSPDGRPGEVWLLVTRNALIALDAEAEGQIVSGPIALGDVEKVRIFQSVGSAFLQAMVEGLYVDVARFSNARRELFDKARIEIERLLQGEPPREQALRRPSDWVCSECGLPLPSRKGACPRCQRRHGIFLRGLGLMKPYWAYGVLILSLLLVRVGLNLVPPYLTRILVDQVLTPKLHAEWLKWFVLALIGVGGCVCLRTCLLVGQAARLGLASARSCGRCCRRSWSGLTSSILTAIRWEGS